jgi:hypothetical protein
MLDGAVADETARLNAEDPMRTGLKQVLQEMTAFAEKLVVILCLPRGFGSGIC